MNGSMECARYDGCWKDALQGRPTKADGTDPNCVNPISVEGQTVPLCMDMIRPEDIVRAIELYYIGKVLTYQQEECNV